MDMGKRIFSRLKKRVKRVLKPNEEIIEADDYDWDEYHNIYSKQISEMRKNRTQILKHGDYIFKNNELIKNRDILPIHPNWTILYETILQLDPKSIVEIGCGWGDHLHNIGLLKPEIEINGLELSDQQILNLNKRHPNLNANIKQLDITLPYPYTGSIFDIAFTQAVIMHIQAGNGHLVALANMFRCATKQVILMENWTRHDFLADIKFLFSKNMIPWKNIYYYYRVLENVENRDIYLLVISSEPLKDYPELTNYALLRDSVKRK
ncbi:MAG: class I SAM-dependent methyltransferase [Candidatus Heimdallarchaeota archaeon]|nr:class I SAM-dependent methyltransferase [Candidatus Heimdallarchaeota archaeon]